MHRARRAAAVSFAILSCAAGAAPLTKDKVPEPLKPWTEWVLHGEEEKLCPFLHGDSDTRHCAWPARLTVSLEAKGGHFSQDWQLQKEEWVPLPGEATHWPLDVKVDGAPAIVAEHEDAPSVFLKPGDHTVQGSFAWDALPDSIEVPPETGLLSLTVQGKPVSFPNRDDDGRLWLQKQQLEEEKAENRLDVRVYRRAVDDIPFVVFTRIELEVSGKNREVVLGKTVLEGFVPMTLESSVPARIEADGRLRVQVRPGHYALTVGARHEGPVTSIPLAAADGPWASEEVWVFEARNDLRLVTVEGVPSIDPQQTTLPNEWRHLPAFRVKPADAMKLDEKRRGDADPGPDQLTLNRDLWLDFNGAGYTVRDAISGKLNRSWRLEMRAPMQLGHVAVGGRDQFITHLEAAEPAAAESTSREGVELRQGTVSMTADSRLESHDSEVGLGWDQDFHGVEGTLHLPPGWRLFHAAGADDVPATWIKTWTLLDLFLSLIIAMAIGRLWSPVWGAVALVTMALTFTESEAPQFVWLAVLAGEALVRVLPAGRFQRLLQLYRLGAWAALVIVCVPFFVRQIRLGLYPAQHPYDASYAPASMVYAEEDGKVADTLAPAAPPPPRQATVDEPAPPKMSIAHGPKKPAKLAEKNKKKEDKAQDEDQAEETATGIEGGVVGGTVGGVFGGSMGLSGKGSVSAGSGAGYGRVAQRQAYTQEIDPNAAVQTGPGIPGWRWTQINLRWNGPVERSQTLRLTLIPPWLNLILAFVRVALIAMLVLVIVGFAKWGRRLLRGGASATALLAVVFAVGAPRSARASDIPREDLLNQLRDRLLEPPQCLPTCASSARLMLEITPGTLRARMEVSAAASTAIPLPGDAKHWTPNQVLLDGKPARGLLRADDGNLWLAVPVGGHQIILEGSLPDRETVQLPLPFKPHHVEATASGWTLDGVHEDGVADDDLQLTRIRKEKNAALAALQPGTLPPFVRIDRTLQLGLTWEVETRVVRMTPAGSAVVLEVPVLEGESVTTPDFRVQNGKVLVNMGPQASEVVWRSVLAPRAEVKLLAPNGVAWTEVWRLDVSPIWHVTLSGIPVIHQQDSSGARVPEWRPWPGESVTLALVRPAGVAGQTLTIDSANLSLSPGGRATDATLSLSLRASRGGQHEVILPENAELQSVVINGSTQPIRQDKQRVVLPIVPGSQRIQLNWRESRGVGFDFRSSTVDLGAPSVNDLLDVRVPDDRWVLFLGGPRMGPAVLFWSVLIVLILVAAGLSRTSLAPLRWYHWVLLNLGLSQVPIPAAAVVVAWFLVLGWRGRHVARVTHPKLFDLLQILIVGWTVAALFILVVAIQQGLLGTPDMQISGNGSSFPTLHWFQDRSGGVLPHASVISVPLLVYRLAMLAWALWLALGMLRWLRWGWTSFIADGVWRPFRRPKSPPPVQATPIVPA